MRELTQGYFLPVLDGKLNSRNCNIDSGFSFEFDFPIEFPRKFLHASPSTLYFGYSEHAREDNRALSLTDEHIASEYQRSAGSVDVREYYLGIFVNAKDRSVSVVRDYFASMPLYWVCIDGTLYLSSSYETLVKVSIRQLGYAEVSLSSLAEHLISTYTSLFSEDSVNGIQSLGSSQTLVASVGKDNNIEIGISNSNLHINEGVYDQLKSKSFNDALSDVLGYYYSKIQNYSKPVWDLSGGLDSSILAGMMSRWRDKPVDAYTGVRNESDDAFVLDSASILCRHFNISTTIDWLPQNLLVPFGDALYANAAPATYSLVSVMGKLLREHTSGVIAAGHGTAIVQGHGGDERFAAKIAERSKAEQEKVIKEVISMPDYFTSKLHALIKISYQSAQLHKGPELVLDRLTQSQSGSYIQAGVWPIFPLHDPYLYMLAKDIPKESKLDKKILREYMYTNGFPAEIYAAKKDIHSTVRHYTSTIIHNLRPLITDIAERSILVSSGFIDKEKLLLTYNSLRIDDSHKAFVILNWLDIEMMFQTIKTHTNNIKLVA